jgi:hypothetical protein
MCQRYSMVKSGCEKDLLRMRECLRKNGVESENEKVFVRETVRKRVDESI